MLTQSIERVETDNMDHRATKNKREKRRVELLRGEFESLKDLLPNREDIKNKSQILWSAKEYIVYLQHRIDELESDLTVPKEETEQERPSCRYSKVCSSVL